MQGVCVCLPLYSFEIANLSLRFGFAKFFDVRDSENCIRGFFRLGYEVGFARVTTPAATPASLSAPPYSSSRDACDHMLPRLPNEFCCHKHAMNAIPGPGNSDFWGTNFSAKQESFNSRLKAEGDDESTNLYISNLPRHFSEAVSTNKPFIAIFLTLAGTRNCIPRIHDPLKQDPPGWHGKQPRCRICSVSFAISLLTCNICLLTRLDSFESRDVCDRIIEEFQNLKLGPDGLPMQIRYADTPAQKELKRITSERRQFRTNEYNVGAYGTHMVGMATPMYNQAGGYRRAPNAST